MKALMRRVCLLLLGSVLMLGMTSGCDTESTVASSPTLHGPVKHPGDTFTVGFECGYVPHGYLDPETGNFVGYDLDLAREVARRNGWKLALKPMDWDRKEEWLNSRKIDCIWNGFKITGRERQYTWSEPYLESFQIVITRTQDNIKTLEDLANKRVAVQSTTPSYDAVTTGKLKILGNTFRQIIPIADFIQLERKLSSGEVDAVIMDYRAAKQSQLVRNAKFSVLHKPLIHTQDGIAFRLGDTALCDQVQRTFKEMVKDGTAGKITRQWFGEDICILTE